MGCVNAPVFILSYQRRHLLLNVSICYHLFSVFLELFSSFVCILKEMEILC